MRTALFAASASVMFLVACDAQPADEPANGANAATNSPATANAVEPGGSPLGAPVSGEQAKKVMHDRHEGMEDIGDAMKLVSAELKKDSPDLAKVRSGAATFERYAPQVKGWYPPGTGPDVGKTRAKAEIWRKPEDFHAKSIAFEQAVTQFSAAARGTDLAAIRAAHAELGKSCKACHDPYRAPDDH